MKQSYINLGKVSVTANGEWNRNNSYERLSIVTDTFTNHTYISKQDVPTGIDITNTDYWQKIGPIGYKNNNIIIISDIDESTEKLKEYDFTHAISSIHEEDRHSGTIVGFYAKINDTTNRWMLFQFQDTDTNNWKDESKWEQVFSKLGDDYASAYPGDKGLKLENFISALQTSLVNTDRYLISVTKPHTAEGNQTQVVINVGVVGIDKNGNWILGDDGDNSIIISGATELEAGVLIPEDKKAINVLKDNGVVKLVNGKVFADSSDPTNNIIAQLYCINKNGQPQNIQFTFTPANESNAGILNSTDKIKLNRIRKYILSSENTTAGGTATNILSVSTYSDKVNINSVAVDTTEDGNENGIPIRASIPLATDSKAGLISPTQYNQLTLLDNNILNNLLIGGNDVNLIMGELTDDGYKITVPQLRPNDYNPDEQEYEDITIPNVTQESNGLMLGSDKLKLDSIILDDNNKIDSSMLPSYVDDVVDIAIVASTLPTEDIVNGDYGFNTTDNRFYLYNINIGWIDVSATKPVETGKIYIATKDGNKQYRWSGTTMIQITSGNLVIGTVTGTVFDGGKGKVIEDWKNTVSRNIVLGYTGNRGEAIIVREQADRVQLITNLVNLSNGQLNEEADVSEIVAATSTTAGIMSATDKSRFDEVYNWMNSKYTGNSQNASSLFNKNKLSNIPGYIIGGAVSGNTDVIVTKETDNIKLIFNKYDLSTGNTTNVNYVINTATSNTAGVMSATDKAKLDKITAASITALNNTQLTDNNVDKLKLINDKLNELLQILDDAGIVTKENDA